MNANQLLYEAEVAMVNTLDLFGATVSYKHRRGETVADIACQVSNSDTRQGTSKAVHDETIFCSMALDFEPKENDEIHYDGDVFIVKRHTKSREGVKAIYDVVTLSHESAKSRRVKK